MYHMADSVDYLWSSVVCNLLHQCALIQYARFTLYIKYHKKWINRDYRTVAQMANKKCVRVWPRTEF